MNRLIKENTAKYNSIPTQQLAKEPQQALAALPTAIITIKKPSSGSDTSSLTPLWTETSKTKLARLQKDAATLKKLKEILNGNCNVLKKTESKRLISSAFANAPRLSNQSAPVAFACELKAFLVEAGVTVSNEKVVAITPSHSLLPSFLDEHSAELLAVLRKRVKSKKIYGNFDGANKGVHHMIKGTSFWF